MITLPERLEVTRSQTKEARLRSEAKLWMGREGPRAGGIHASELSDPRKAYWARVDPQPLSEREIMLFFVGKILHAFILGGGPMAAQGEPSRTSESLGITYSPDRIRPDGTICELKTNRRLTEPSGFDDIQTYLEQLLVYMAAENTYRAELWVLYLNLKDKKTGRTHPDFRVYDVTLPPAELPSLQQHIRETASQLQAALASRNHRLLPLCRAWMCSSDWCPWWEKCQPEGRWVKRNA